MNPAFISSRPQIMPHISSSSSTQQKQKDPSLNLTKLPAVLIAKTLSYLPDWDLASASLACKTISKSITPVFWKERLCREEHPIVAQKRFAKKRNWKATYKDLRKERERDASYRERDASYTENVRFRPNMVEIGVYRNNFANRNKFEGSKFIFNNGEYMTNQLKDWRQNQKTFFDKFKVRPSDFFNGQPLIKMKGIL